MEDLLGGHPVPDDIQTILRRRRGGGRPLPGPMAETLGNAFTADLAGVRIHTDPEAASVSRYLQAEAFAYGQDLYFSTGAYQPHTSSGQKLLAHEVAHTLQSGRGPSAAPVIGRANDPAEREADDLANSALRSTARTGPEGAPKQYQPHASMEGTLARKLSLRGPERPDPDELITDFLIRKFAGFTVPEAYSARDDFRSVADFPGQAIRSLWRDRYWHSVNVSTDGGQEQFTQKIVQRMEALGENRQLIRLAHPRPKEVIMHNDPRYRLEAGHIPVIVNRPPSGEVSFTINGLNTCIGVIMELTDGDQIHRVSASHFVTPEAVAVSRDRGEARRWLRPDAQDQLDAQIRATLGREGYLVVKLVRADLNDGTSRAQTESAMELIRDHIGLVRKLYTYQLHLGDSLEYVLDMDGGWQIGPGLEPIEIRGRRSGSAQGY